MAEACQEFEGSPRLKEGSPRLKGVKAASSGTVTATATPFGHSSLCLRSSCVLTCSGWEWSLSMLILIGVYRPENSEKRILHKLD